MKLFIAIDVPPWITRAMDAVQHQLPPETDGVRRVKLDNLHITLKFLGEVKKQKVQAIASRLDELSYRKFDVPVKGIGGFPSEEYVRVIWAECRGKEIAGLADKISKAFPEFPAEPFSGHLTIARVLRKADLRKFFAEHKDARFGNFKVEKFYLMQSELSSSGPKYSVLAEYQLKE